MRGLAPMLLATEAAASTIGLGLKRAPPADPVRRARSLMSRADKTLNLQAINDLQMAGYYAEVQIGTPPQTVTLHLDTGSSDTWVNSQIATMCEVVSQSSACDSFFRPDDSSTFEVVEEGGFNITYLDGRNVEGDYFNDTITIDGQQIKNQQLGISRVSADSPGIMGLGFSAGVSAANENETHTPSETYPAIVDHMVAQGLIKRAAYSLYLNDLQADAGSVLFGGIDTKKFIGDLATIPMTSVSTGNASNPLYLVLAVAMDRVRLMDGDDEKGATDSNAMQAVLDSGSTVSLMSDAFLRTVEKAFDVQVVEQQGAAMAFIDCKYSGKDGHGKHVEFVFGKKTISVPLEELVLNSFDGEDDEIERLRDLLSDYLGMDDLCMFGIQPLSMVGVPESDETAANFVLLGDTVLRSAYVVYDLSNHQVGLAQANLNATESQVVELDEGTSFPDVRGVDAPTNENGAEVFRAPWVIQTICMTGLVMVFGQVL